MSNAAKIQLELTQDEVRYIDRLLHQSMKTKSGQTPQGTETLSDTDISSLRDRITESFPRSVGAGQRGTTNT